MFFPLLKKLPPKRPNLPAELFNTKDLPPEGEVEEEEEEKSAQTKKEQKCSPVKADDEASPEMVCEEETSSVQKRETHSNEMKGNEHKKIVFVFCNTLSVRNVRFWDEILLLRMLNCKHAYLTFNTCRYMSYFCKKTLVLYLGELCKAQLKRRVLHKNVRLMSQVNLIWYQT